MIAEALLDLRRALWLAGANERIRVTVPRPVAAVLVKELRRHYDVPATRRADWPRDLAARFAGIEVWIEEDRPD